ncbi:MAG: hypothetical protein C0175_01085 [Caldisericum exile]|uniref:Uncharacterized protein n=1 Tax=Caldisericum exile TaxID=693075 RepID=A0A2J6X962_9BACT|nr:MAG: hypothetical protein C0175_01085 [Caldisericum exile]
MILNCPYFEKCDAPICPMDPSKERAVWYPDEEICRNREFGDLDLIISQKKIARLNRRHEVQGIFTYNMLNRPLIIRKGISGLSEDQDLDETAKSEKTWIQKHRGMSKELKNSLGERLKMNEGTKKEGFTNA